MADVYWLREVPDDVRNHETLSPINYEDFFYGRATVLDMSPEAWMRVLRRAPIRLRLLSGLAILVQRHILGLRLREASVARPFGWKVAERGDHWFRLEASSWMGEAHLLFHRDRRHVSVATFLRYDRRIGAIVWAPVSHLHRQAGLALLRHVLNTPESRLSRRLAMA